MNKANPTQEDLSFFQGVEQLETELIGEKIKFPIFYYKAAGIFAIFPARYKKARELLPKADYHPLSPFPGVALVGIGAFAYEDTDIRPYNELAIFILMTYRERPRCPLRYLQKSMAIHEIHSYIVHLPVTTEIALVGGVQLYNYPKFLSTISFKENATRIGVDLKEKRERILQLVGEKLPPNQSFRLRAVTYPVKEGNAQHADVLMNAQEAAETFRPKHTKLILNEKHPIGRELNELLLWKKPIYWQLLPKFQAILYGPSRLE